MDNKKTKSAVEERQEKKHCNCNNHKTCEKNQESCDCGENCKCEHNCNCDEECNCEHETVELNKEAVYLEALQRTMAEFDNYRKRMAIATEKSRLDGVCQTIISILPSVDALDKAVEMCKGNKQVEDGLKLVKENILNSFKNLGLKEIEALNKPFDPNYHNAVVATEEEGVAPGIVLEEYQKGYILGDKVVRYTMCKVSK